MDRLLAADNLEAGFAGLNQRFGYERNGNLASSKLGSYVYDVGRPHAVTPELRSRLRALPMSRRHVAACQAHRPEAVFAAARANSK